MNENYDWCYFQGYANLSVGQLQSIRYALLNFLQDIQVRASVLLQNGYQHQDGTFKLHPAEHCYKGKRISSTLFSLLRPKNVVKPKYRQHEKQV